MTDDVKRFTFLLKQKPICTQSPIKTFLGTERHRELRSKYKLELGLDLLDDRCGNVFNCKTLDIGCIGRPFPLDNEIYKALQSINVDVTIGNYKGKEVYIAKAIVDCTTCPFRVGCETSCPAQDSYLRRTTKPESNPPENSLVPYDDFEKGIYKALEENAIQHCEYGDWIDESLPMDCLDSFNRKVMEMSLYNSLSQVEISSKLGITQQRVSKIIKSSTERLKEFGLARKAIRETRLIPKVVVEYYINNLTQQDISDKIGVTQQYVSRLIKEWYISNIPK